ncbi:hypothetical protein [Moraxella lacunata]
MLRDNVPCDDWLNLSLWVNQSHRLDGDIIMIYLSCLLMSSNPKRNGL